MKLLEQIEDALIPVARALHAAGVDVAHVHHETHLGVRVDRVEQERRGVEQGLAVRPVAEHGQRQFVRGSGVDGCAVPGAGVGANEGAAERGGDHEPFLHGSFRSFLEFVAWLVTEQILVSVVEPRASEG